SLVNCLLEIGPCSPPLRNDPETIRETFQAVSRNAETLALQMNHLRELDLETIKKISLKRFGLSPENAILIFAQTALKPTRTHPWRPKRLLLCAFSLSL